MAASADPTEFAKEMTTTYREKMRVDVDEYYSDEYFERLGGPEEVIKVEFPHTAWRELFIGCLPANRQLHLLYEKGDPYFDDRDLVVGLLNQIRDEVKHAKTFSNLSEQFGVPCDLVSMNPENHERLIEQTRAAVEWDEPHYVASGFQCSTEIMAAFMIQNMADYLEPEYPDIATVLRDIASDEGDHVHCGRLLIKRFATPDDFEIMEDIAQRKYDAATAVLKSL